MNIVIFITGTICSGKSTLAQRISKSLNIDLLSETNSNGFFGIIDRVMNNDFTSPVIIEHAEIYNLINKNRDLEISRYFDKILIIVMNVSDDILTNNLNERKSRELIGDYLNIDMFAMKKDIENYINDNNDYTKYILNINSIDDYEGEYHKVISFLSDILQEV